MTNQQRRDLDDAARDAAQYAHDDRPTAADLCEDPRAECQGCDDCSEDVGDVCGHLLCPACAGEWLGVAR